MALNVPHGLLSRAPALRLACIGAALLLFASGASAVTRYVWTNSPGAAGGFTSWLTAATNIQQAVHASSAGDLILVTNGVYSAGGSNAPGGIVSNRVAVTAALTVRSVNGAGVTHIKGTGPAGPAAIRGVYLCDGAVLVGFTITNGYTDATDDANGKGGGIYCQSQSGIISNCVIAGNTSYDAGGGVFGGTLYGCVLSNNTAVAEGVGGGGAYGSFLYGCTVTVNVADYGGGGENCTFSNCVVTANAATSQGGGVSGSGSRLYNCTVSGNSAGGFGGGCGDCTIYGSRISGNSAQYGGGASYGSLSGSILSNNYASGSGGGAYGSALDRCTVTVNRAASDGGGLAGDGASATNCLLVANAADNTGGGAAGNLTLRNCTLVVNAATNFGGGAAACNLINCIVWYNQADGGSNCSGANLIFSSSTPLPAGEGNRSDPPDFLDMAAGDLRLAGNSPCVNAGSNESWMATAVDLAGRPRVVGAYVDMGAHEAVPVHYVATNGGHVSPFVAT